MFKDTKAFSSFSVDDVPRARQFYGEVLGLDLSEQMGGIGLRLGGGGEVFVYPKANHTPATFTVLNFPVNDLSAAIDELTGKGVTMERYDGFDQDERGIASGPDGPHIAWFKDPAGNVLSVMQI